jgi:ParB family transcriptional regulator, chromosome partitioning protein
MAKAKAAPAPAVAPTEITYLPLSSLHLSALNVRTVPATPAEIRTLAESIAAIGLRQNLTVVPMLGSADDYEVVAGGNRLAALALLQADSRITGDYQVPVAITQRAAATTVSLTENHQRKALHPVDEAVAFAELVNLKTKPAEIALVYGVTPRYVQQRLQLAALAPEVLQAGRECLPMLALQAFTIESDHERQREVLAQLRAEGWLDPEDEQDAEDIAREIHDRLAGAGIEADHRFVKFIGIDAYRAAGGEVVEDLFAEDDEGAGLLRDRALVERLVTKKLKAEGKKLLAAGWGAVHIDIGAPDDRPTGHYVYPRTRQATEAEAAEIAALDAELKGLEDAASDRADEIRARLDAIDDVLTEFTADEKKLLTVLLDVSHYGLLDTDHLLPKENAEAFYALRHPPAEKGDGPTITATAIIHGDDEDEEPEPPAAQIARLKAHAAATRARCSMARARIAEALQKHEAGEQHAALMASAVELLDAVLLEE